MKPYEYAVNAANEVVQILLTVSADEMDAVANRILEANAIFVAGAGRSLLMLKAFAMRLMHFGIKVHVVGETTTPAITEKDLLIVASGSGETATIQVITQKAAAAGAGLVMVTTNRRSSLALIANHVILISAGSKQDGPYSSWQPAGNSFEQSLLLILDGIAIFIAEKRGFGLERSLTRHANLE